MTAEELSMAAGMALSLGFRYIPGLSGWYEALLPEQKRLIMLALLAATAGVVFALACSGLGQAELGVDVSCDRQGGLGLARTFLLAVIANQAVFLISPRKWGGGRRR